MIHCCRICRICLKKVKKGELIIWNNGVYCKNCYESETKQIDKLLEDMIE